MTDASKPPRREPTSTARMMAIQMRDNYVALIDEGFTPAEAMTLTQQLIVSAAIYKPTGR